MSEHDIEKLLGGFAADTLMPEERIRLYTAAMQDQQVINALADEQALKALLADPLVRDRLLQASRTPDSSPSISWWDWLKRPTGRALAGGLAAVLFAVTFARMYPESLHRIAPSAPASQPSTSAPSPASESQLTAIKNEDSPAPTSHAMQVAAGTSIIGVTASSFSARALFYGNRSVHDEKQTVTAGHAPGSNSSSESNQMGAGKPIETAPASRPLGLRYSFVVRETAGQDREVDTAAAANGSGPMRISVEPNRDAFLQILQSLGPAGTRLWWPSQETGKISLKVLAGKRSEIPLPPPAEGGLLHIIVRLSLKPFAPLTMQEVGMLDRFAANLLIETVTPGGTGIEERATYVVSQDPSQTAQMTMSIPIRR